MDTALEADVAARKLREISYRVVLCDLMLPGSSGFELIELAQATEGDTQVIVITGYATLENAIRSFKLGVFDFLPKPFDVEELQGVVCRALRYRKAASSGVGVKEPPAPASEKRYFLGRHAWARLELEGSAMFGVGETLPGMLGEVEKVELPDVDSQTVQGKRCARVVADKGKVHRVWAPLSGQIIALNQRSAAETDLIDVDPYGAGWLLRIIPSNLEEELEHLTRR